MNPTTDPIPDRAGVIAPQSALPSHESAAQEMLSEVKLAQIIQLQARVADRRERVHVIAPQSPLAISTCIVWHLISPAIPTSALSTSPPPPPCCISSRSAAAAVCRTEDFGTTFETTAEERLGERQLTLMTAK